MVLAALQVQRGRREGRREAKGWRRVLAALQVQGGRRGGRRGEGSKLRISGITFL
jgi:hypothetical protein